MYYWWHCDTAALNMIMITGMSLSIPYSTAQVFARMPVTPGEGRLRDTEAHLIHQVLPADTSCRCRTSCVTAQSRVTQSSNSSCFEVLPLATRGGGMSRSPQKIR